LEESSTSHLGDKGVEHVRGVSSFILFSSRTNYQGQLGSLECTADFTHEDYDLGRKVIGMFFWCTLVRIEDTTWGAVPRRIDFVMANLKGNRIEHSTSGIGVQMQ
jgi:hypothetical protein